MEIEQLPFEWDNLPLELQTQIVTQMVPSTASRLGSTSRSNRDLITTLSTEKDYINANFKTKDVVIMATDKPLSWLYNSYPLLKVIIPHSILGIKKIFKEYILHYDFVITGNIFMNAHINGKFTAIFTNKYGTAIKITGDTVFNLATSRSYLIGDYNIEEMVLHNNNNNGNDEGDEGHEDNQQIVSGLKAVFRNGKPYNYIVGMNTEEGTITLHNISTNNIYVYSSNDINNNNIITVYNSLSPSQSLTIPLSTEEGNNAQFPNLSLKEETVISKASNDVTVETLKEKQNGKLVTTQVTYYQPNPGYEASAKIKYVYNGSNVIRSRSILDIYDEPIVEKRYANFTLSFKTDPDNKYGYLGFFQRFGYNVNYSWCLIPEPNQISLKRVTEAGVLKVNYGPIGDIISMTIIDLYGQPIFTYPQQMEPEQAFPQGIQVPAELQPHQNNFEHLLDDDMF